MLSSKKDEIKSGAGTDSVLDDAYALDSGVNKNRVVRMGICNDIGIVVDISRKLYRYRRVTEIGVFTSQCTTC